MTTLLLVVFLVAHGLVHLAVWLPKPEPVQEKPPPFDPGRSALLTKAHVRPDAERRLASRLAVTTAATYVLGALLLPLSAQVAVPVLVVAALVGLVLKATYFNPWLVVGVALDVVVLTSAAVAWPVAVR
jgi:hypothetical protein